MFAPRLSALLAFGLIAHEILSRLSPMPVGPDTKRSPRLAVLGIRILVLLATLTTAVAYGYRVHQAGLLTPQEPAHPLADQFAPQGDPGLTRLLAAQAPRLPYPASGDRRALEAWKSAVVSELRSRILVRRNADAARSFSVLSREETRGVRRTLIVFESDDGTKIPAFVFEPVGVRSRTPAVLVVPGHGRGIVGCAGLVAPDYQNGAALELARSGFVTLTPELRGFGLLGPPQSPEHRVVAHNALAVGSSYLAVVVRDLVAALDVLTAWQNVDAARLGAAGASLGGELVGLLAAVDPRVKAASVHGYSGRTGVNLGPRAGADSKAPEVPHGCFVMPGIQLVIAPENWLRLLAPRPLHWVCGKDDCPPSTRSFELLLAETYATAGAPHAFVASTPPGGHEFFVGQTIAFFRSRL